MEEPLLTFDVVNQETQSEGRGRFFASARQQTDTVGQQQVQEVMTPVDPNPAANDVPRRGEASFFSDLRPQQNEGQVATSDLAEQAARLAALMNNLQSTRGGQGQGQSEPVTSDPQDQSDTLTSDAQTQPLAAQPPAREGAVSAGSRVTSGLTEALRHAQTANLPGSQPGGLLGRRRGIMGFLQRGTS